MRTIATMAAVILLAAGSAVFVGCSNGTESGAGGDTKVAEPQTVQQKSAPNAVQTTFDNDYYHADGCEDLKGRDAYPGPIDEAKLDGFTACPKCNPPA
jgi:predicted small secreted protein